MTKKTESHITINVVTTLGAPIHLPEMVTVVDDNGVVRKEQAIWEAFKGPIFCHAGKYEVLGTLKSGESLKGIVHVFATNNVIKVAAVGDSITYGMGVSGRTTNAYPSQLNYRLGRNYQVENYGNSGRTLLENGDAPYIKTREYTRSLEFNPDVVIIMLGTNDTKARNFKNIDRFVDDYVKLIHSYAALPAKPIIYISLPPIVARTAYGITQANLEQIIPLIWVAGQQSGLDITIIDNFTATKNAGEFIPDGVHPNARGAAILANNVLAHLQGRYTVPPHNTALNDYFATYGGLNLGSVMNGLSDIGSLAHKNWVSYKNIELEGKNIQILASIPYNNTKVIVRKDSEEGEIIGAADLARTGSVNNYANYIIDLQGQEGIHDIYFSFERAGSGVNAELVRLRRVDFNYE